MSRHRVFSCGRPPGVALRQSECRGSSGGSGVIAGRVRRLPVLVGVLLWVLLSHFTPWCGRAMAATLTWTGAAGDNNVNTAGNWSPAQVPVSGDTLVFSGSAGLLPQLAADLTVASISFGSAAQAFTLGGAGIYTINSGITNSSASTETLNNGIKLGANQSWSATSGNLIFNGAVNLQTFTLTVTGGKATTISGIVSGTGDVTKTGTGSLTLSGNNNYSGTTNLATGSLTIGSDTAVGTGLLVIGSGSSSTTLAATGATRTLGNAVQVGRNFSFNSTNDLIFSSTVTLSGNRKVTVGSTGALTLGGVVTSTNRSLTKLGTGTLALNGVNTFSGGLLLSAGTVTVGNNAAAGTGTLTLGTGTIQAGVSGLTLANAITFTGNTTYGGTLNLSFSGAGNLSGPRTFTVLNPNTTFSGVISGANSLSKAGAGTLTLGGANTFSAGTNIQNGTLVLDSNTAGGTATITVGDALATGTAPASLLFSATAGRTVANALSVPVGSTGMRTIGGLNTTGVDIFSGTVALGTDATLTEGTGGEVNFTGIVSGAGGITKTGAGTVRLSNTNTFSGATLVSAGTLAYGASNALGTGSVNVNGGTLDMGASQTDSVGAVTLSSGSIIGSGTSALTSTSGFAVQSGTISAILAGAVGLTKDTSGTVTLSGANIFSGTTTVSLGTLSYGANDALGTGALTVSGGTLDMGTGRTDSVGAVTLTSGSLLGGAGSVLTSTSGFTLQSGTVTAALAGSVALTKNTTGTVLISGANAYTGATTISAGTLRLGATETLPNASAVTVSAGATLDMNDLTDTVGSLAGAGNLLLGAGTLIAGGDNTSTSFTGTAGGSGGITKNGTGTLTLGGTNSFTGATNVNTGTLALGSAASAPASSRVTVAGGAIFNVAGFSAGIGSLAGAGSVTLGAGTLSAGGDGTSSTFSGIVSGTGGFTKAGTGTLTMMGANSFTGALTVSAGGVTFSGATGTATGATSVTIQSGASLILDNASAANADRIGNSAVINIQGGNLTLNSGASGTNETVGQLNLLSSAGVTVTHNGTAAQSSALTFSSMGSVTAGATLNFAGTGLGGALGTAATGPHIFITGQANGLIGGWARVGSDFASYGANGVSAFSAYYTGSLGVNVNDPSTIVQLSSTSAAAAYTLTNAGTTSDGGLLVTDLALVDLGASATRTLNLVNGGLIKKSVPDSVISGAGRLTAGGTVAGNLNVAVEAARTLTISSAIINNAGADGIYGNAGDGVVGVVKSDLGTLVLSGANTFSGDVFLNEGALSIAADAGFGAVTNDIFLSGGTLMITAGFTANSGRRFVIAAGLTSTLDVAAAQTLLLTGLSDLLATGSTASTLVKTGAGDLVLADSNPNFTGTARISSGALELRLATSLGTGTITLNGGTLRLRADTSTTFTNPIALLADSAIAASVLTSGTPALSLGTVGIGAQTLSLSASGGATLGLGGTALSGNATFNTTAGTTTLGAISGAYGFTKSGTGTLQLTAASTYSGATSVQGGTLRLANATAIPLASGVTVGASGTIDLNSLSANLGSIAGSGAITLGSGTLTVGGNGSASNFSGIISGAGGLTKTAGQVLTLSGANSYTGATNILTGEILLGASGTLPSTTAVAISAGADLNLATFSQTVASITGAGTIAIGTGALTVGDSSNFTFTGTITGTGTLRKTGTGKWSLSGNSPYLGVVTVAGGIIEVLANNAIGDPVVQSGSQITLAPGVTVSAEPLTLAGTGTDGNGALQVPSGSATWDGVVNFSANASTGAATGATLTLGRGIDLSGQTFTVSGAGNTTTLGVISGAGTLQKTDAGTLTLSGASTFTGRTVVIGGVLNVANNAALGATGLGNETEIRSGAALFFTGATGINIGVEGLLLAGTGTAGTGAIQSSSGDNVSTGPVTLTADASVNVATGSSLSMTGGIGESGGARNFTKNGPGTFLLGGTNTFTGTLAVADGTLQTAAANTLNGNPGVSLSATATLDLNDFSDTLGSLSGAGTVTFGTLLTGGGSLSVGSNGASTTFTGTITGTGFFEKVGAGSLTLTTANTFTGTTTISGGTLVAGNDLAFGAATQALILNGGGLASDNSARSLAYPITVNAVTGNQITGSNNLTLTGGASGTGTLTVNMAANANTVTINPATANSFAPGMLRLNSGTLLLGGANKIGDTTALTFGGGVLNTAGNSDSLGALLIAANSSLDFGTSNTVRLQFASAGWTGGVLSVINWTGTPLTSGNADQLLISSAGPLDANFLNAISFQGQVPGAIAFNVGGGLFEVVPVPEPATIFGGAALLAFVGWRERRRFGRMFFKA